MPSKALLPLPQAHRHPARTVWSHLPGRASSAVALVNGTYWFIMDPDKSHLYGQAIQLLG